MVLYCVDVPTFLGTVMVHSCAYHKCEEVFYMVDKNEFKKRHVLAILENLVIKGVVKTVYQCDMYPDVSMKCTREGYINKICMHFEEQLQQYKIDIKDFEIIYCLNDIYDGMINLYFNLIKREYVWMAMGSKISCKLKGYVHEEFQVFDREFQYLSPFAPYAKLLFQKECEKGSDILNYKSDYFRWSKRDALNKIMDSVIDKIVEAFGGVSDIAYGYLLVTNSYGAATAYGDFSPRIKRILGYRTCLYPEIFSVMNNTALDYFIKDKKVKVFLKTHPNDPIEDRDIEAIYGEQVKNFTKLPFEILGRYLEIHQIYLAGCISYTHSGRDILKGDFLEKNIYLGISYITCWYFYDSLYVLGMLAEYLKKDIYTDSALHRQLQMLKDSCSWSTDLYDYTDEGRDMSFADNWKEWEYYHSCMKSISSGKDDIRDSIVVIDSIKLRKNSIDVDQIIKSFDDSNLICFLNFDLSEMFFERKHQDFVVPLVIKKFPHRDNRVPIYRDEVLWFYTLGTKNRREIINFEMYREMHYRRISIMSERMNPSMVEDEFNAAILQHEIKALGNEF